MGSPPIAGFLLMAVVVAAEAPKPRPVPVVVELFTSEGCSSCPPADQALARLVERPPVAGAAVIPLSFHVDYWNHLGWADPFSSPEFSSRQEAYDQGISGPYTPQMIVDGRTGLVGDEERAREAIEAAARAPKGQLSISLKPSGGADLEVAVEVKSLPLATGAKPVVFAALTEDNLATRVLRGENAGRTLHHVGVVRVLRYLGPAQIGSRTTATLSLDSRWKRQDLKVVVFVQDPRAGIIAADSARIPSA